MTLYELSLIAGCLLVAVAISLQPWFKPRSREIVYGETAFDGRMEIANLKLRHLDQQNRFHNATTDEERKVAYDAMTTIENEFDELELKYFGPKEK